ncbi:tripartite tricarboxylate transporter substrate-binding protein [Variovorax sp. ZS18.2.2]|uniref:Bug family tripartite tricarboxylate transporter substrate binding protein n=1 Tax=Variovorax sp. ZS18.2.2 TaxID=2971255 RepID=UPI0021514D5C|nr:tripartite tricarboxylate transporter substrate-binding protein [Variovorax sp. ZS18.2.2]MCR6479396.1 tripartite tricarboxylate transporter substrate-binding protein [Variovorax sp. ZS18.2.2]
MNTRQAIRPARRRALRAAMALGLAGALAVPAAWAQKYPDKPIRLIVGYSAGGGVDAVARLLSSRLSTVLGQQVIVENRSGATGLIAADLVAKAAPDGYTLMMGDSALLIAKLLQPKIAIDPLTSFKPVAGAFISPLMIVTGNDFPAKTPAELVAQLKANPGRFSFATSGVGTVQHLGFEMLKQSTGSFVVHVPYRGAAQIVPDVIGGQVPIGVVSATAAMAQAKAGKLRAVALMNNAKLEGAESVAPLADALPGFDVAPRIFVLAPAGTPNEIVEKLSAAVKAVLDTPEAGAAAAAQGTLRAYATPAQLGKDMADETVRWKRIITEQRIVAEGG